MAFLVKVVVIITIALMSSIGPKTRKASKDPAEKLLINPRAKNESTLEQIEVIKAKIDMAKTEDTPPEASEVTKVLGNISWKKEAIKLPKVSTLVISKNSEFRLEKKEWEWVFVGALGLGWLTFLANIKSWFFTKLNKNPIVKAIMMVKIILK